MNEPLQPTLRSTTTCYARSTHRLPGVLRTFAASCLRRIRRLYLHKGAALAVVASNISRLTLSQSSCYPHGARQRTRHRVSECSPRETESIDTNPRPSEAGVLDTKWLSQPTTDEEGERKGQERSKGYHYMQKTSCDEVSSPAVPGLLAVCLLSVGGARRKSTPLQSSPPHISKKLCKFRHASSCLLPISLIPGMHLRSLLLPAAATVGRAVGSQGFLFTTGAARIQRFRAHHLLVNSAFSGRAASASTHHISCIK